MSKMSLADARQCARTLGAKQKSGSFGRYKGKRVKKLNLPILQTHQCPHRIIQVSKVVNSACGDGGGPHAPVVGVEPGSIHHIDYTADVVLSVLTAHTIPPPVEETILLVEEAASVGESLPIPEEVKLACIYHILCC